MNRDTLNVGTRGSCSRTYIYSHPSIFYTRLFPIANMFQMITCMHATYGLPWGWMFMASILIEIEYKFKNLNVNMNVYIKAPIIIVVKSLRFVS